MAYYPLLGEPVLNILAIVDRVVGLGSFHTIGERRVIMLISIDPSRFVLHFLFNISSLLVTWAVEEYYMTMLIEFGTQDEQAVIIHTYLRK